MSIQLHPSEQEEHTASSVSVETPPAPSAPVVVRTPRRNTSLRIEVLIPWAAVFLLTMLLLIGVIETGPIRPLPVMPRHRTTRR